MEKKNIMIVEDEKIVGLSLKYILESENFEVIGPFSHGEDVVEFLLNNEMNIDLILMDINLAGDMDGIMVAEIVKEKYKIPFVYLTAYSDEKTLKRAKKTEPMGYIIKPFEKKNLLITTEIAMYKYELFKKMELLNSELELRVLERTGELIKANDDLKKEIVKREEINRKLQDLEEFRVNFLRSVSHEIKTPLNVIFGNVQLLEMGVFGNLDHIEKQLVSIKKSVQIAMNLVERLLELSRAETGVINLQVETIVFDSFSSMVEQYRVLSQQKNIEFDFEFKGIEPFLGDYNVWVTIISNLLSNAVKFTEKGSVKASFVSDTDKINLTVADTGIGIADEDKEKVFLPFFTSKGALSGNGLGLAMVKKMVELMGGKIFFYKSGKKGTIFEITVPQIHLAGEVSHE